MRTLAIILRRLTVYSSLCWWHSFSPKSINDKECHQLCSVIRMSIVLVGVRLWVPSGMPGHYPIIFHEINLDNLPLQNITIMSQVHIGSVYDIFALRSMVSPIVYPTMFEAVMIIQCILQKGNAHLDANCDEMGRVMKSEIVQIWFWIAEIKRNYVMRLVFFICFLNAFHNRNI